jgi:hypothetical protein
MPPKKPTRNKTILDGVGIFGPIKGSMKNKNLFYPLGSKVFEKTDLMRYSEYLNKSGRSASFEKN